MEDPSTCLSFFRFLHKGQHQEEEDSLYEKDIKKEEKLMFVARDPWEDQEDSQTNRYPLELGVPMAGLFPQVWNLVSVSCKRFLGMEGDSEEFHTSLLKGRTWGILGASHSTASTIYNLAISIAAGAHHGSGPVFYRHSVSAEAKRANDNPRAKKQGPL